MGQANEVTTRTGSPAIATMPGIQLVTLLTGSFMASFDFFVVNVAAPSIQRDLSASSWQLELIVGAYAFAYAAGMVLGGRLGDLFGHRDVFSCGMLAFAAASTFCGLAGGPQALIGARLLQGAAAAAMLPQVLAIISARTVGAGRARAMAWYGVSGGLGSLAGQVLGGLLVTADVGGLGWRMIFLINLPIGLAGAAAARRVLTAPVTEPPTRRTLDAGGAGGLATGVALLLVPLSMGHQEGCPAWAWACMGMAVPVLGATLMWQMSLERRGRQPLLPVRLFAVPSFRLGMLSAAAFMAMFASYMFALALLLQTGYGLDPLQAGLAFAPSALTFLIAALLVPRLPARAQRHSVVAGALTAAAALAVISVLARAGSGHAWTGVVVPLAAVVSLGNGAILPSLIGLALAQVPPGDAGAGAGAVATAQQFSAAAGVAILGTVFFAAAGHSVHVGAGHGMAWVAGFGAALSLVIAACGTALRRDADRRAAVRRATPGARH